MAQDAHVLRANTYIPIDEEKEEQDHEYAIKNQTYRAAVRAAGFKIIPKAVRRYRAADGTETMTANADLDLGIDAVVQARELDYVVIVSGDSDFIRAVQAIQDAGCRVDIVGFHNVSRNLKETADNFISGFVIPGLIPADQNRRRGYFGAIDTTRNFAFVSCFKVFDLHDTEDVYLNGRDLDNAPPNAWMKLKLSHAVVEFEQVENEKGLRAVKASILE
jgi:hypothetical protein